MSLKLESIGERKYQFEFVEFFEKTKIEIVLPDLRNLKFEKWGDWGEMYEFELKATDPINVTYNGKSKTLEQSHLRVESPIVADERNKFPFYFVIEDSENEISFFLYLDSSYNLKKVRTEKESPSPHKYSFKESSYQEAM